MRAACLPLPRFVSLGCIQVNSARKENTSGDNRQIQTVSIRIYHRHICSLELLDIADRCREH